MTISRFLLFAALYLMTPVAVQGQLAAEEVRYQNILKELRCLVCQNQNLAESDAGLAGDLRLEIKRMLATGKSDEEIFAFMTKRYGDFVRYRPPFNYATLPLWVAPFVLLLVGILFLFKNIGTRIHPQGRQ